jgi:hypothetical protein
LDWVRIDRTVRGPRGLGVNRTILDGGSEFGSKQQFFPVSACRIVIMYAAGRDREKLLFFIDRLLLDYR